MSAKKANLVVLGLALGLISAIAAGLLGCVDALTKKQIIANEKAAQEKALQKVLPAFDSICAKIAVIKKADKTEIEFVTDKNSKEFEAMADCVILYAAEKDGKVVGFAGTGFSPKGYGGNVYAMVGLKPDGKIIRLIITKQNETPGLGTVVTNRVRTKTIWDLLGKGEKVDENALPPNKVLDQFDGHAAVKGDSWPMPWAVSKDGPVHGVTGATISSRAVTDVTYKIALSYSENKEQIDAKIQTALKGKSGE